MVVLVRFFSFEGLLLYRIISNGMKVSVADSDFFSWYVSCQTNFNVVNTNALRYISVRTIRITTSAL